MMGRTLAIPIYKALLCIVIYISCKLICVHSMHAIQAHNTCTCSYVYQYYKEPFLLLSGLADILMVFFSLICGMYVYL